MTYRGPGAETPPDGFQPVEAVVGGQGCRGAFRVAGRAIEVTYGDAVACVEVGALRPDVAARLILQQMAAGHLPPPP